NDPNIRIFAATLTTNTTPETSPAGGFLDHNLPPWANAGPNQRINATDTNAATAVQLDGTQSADPDASIVSYLWSLNGETIATGPVANVTLPIGTNIVILTVTDDHGQSGSAETSVTILPPLSVTLSASPTNAGAAPAIILFTGQASGSSVGSTLDTTDDHTGTIA